MANKKLSEIVSEQSNPVIGDRMEISHESAPSSGIWSSLFMTLETLKDWVLEYANDYKITELSFTGTEEKSYTLSRYELITHVIFKYNSSLDTISVGVAGNTTLYVDNSSDQVIAVIIYRSQSDAAQRVIKLNSSATCTVKLLSLKNL